MTHEEFKTCLEELDGQGAKTLSEKNARYSSSDDALHNFKSGAEIMGGTPAQACWGYLTKHLTALRDMIQRDNFSNRDDFLEKVQDSINYLRFIWALGNEAESNRSFYDRNINSSDCRNCANFDINRDSKPCCRCKNTAVPGTPEYNSRPLLFERPDKCPD